METKRIALWAGTAGFLLTLVLPAPEGMPPLAWPTAGLVWWMAVW
jgi:sodium-dependent dicarboxylate transporter 2/3/5